MTETRHYTLSEKNALEQQGYEFMDITSLRDMQPVFICTQYPEPDVFNEPPRDFLGDCW